MSYNRDALVIKTHVRIKDTSPSGASSGGLVVAGSIATTNTDITGEVAVNDTKMTPNKDDIVYEREYTVLADQNAWVNVPGFSFDSSRTRSFQANVKADTPTASTLFELNGLYKATGWAFNYTFTGDLLPLQFAVVDFSGVGQVQVKNPSADQVDLRFRASTTAIKDTTPITQTVGLITGGNSRFTVGSFIQATATGGLESTPGTLQFDKNSFKITTPMEVNSQSTVSGTAGAALQVAGGVSVAKGVRTNILAVGTTRANTSLNVQGDINFTNEFLQDELPFDKSLFEQSGGNIFYNTSGNVGIRTTSPTTNLDVLGTGKITGAVTLGNTYSPNVKSVNVTASSVHITNTLSSATLTMGNVVTADTLAVGGTLVAASVSAADVLDTRVTTGNLNFTTAQVNDIAFNDARVPLTTIGTANITNVSTVNVSLDNVTSTNIDVSGGVTASAVRSQWTTTDTLNTNVFNTQFLQVTQTFSGGDIRNTLGVTDVANANVSTLESGDIRIGQSLQSERVFANTIDVTDTIVSSANIHTVVTPTSNFTNLTTSSITANTLRATSLQTESVQNSTTVTIGNLQATSTSTAPTFVAKESTTAANLRSTTMLGDHLTAQFVDASNTLVSGQVDASQNARVGQLNLSTLASSSTMTGGSLQVSGDINAGDIRSSTMSTDTLTTRNIELTNVSTSTIRQDNVTTGSLEVNFGTSVTTVNANNVTHTQSTMTNLAATAHVTPNFVVPGGLTSTNVGSESVSGTNLIAGTTNVADVMLTSGTFGNLAGGQMVSGAVRSTNATVSNLQTHLLSTSTLNSTAVSASNVVSGSQQSSTVDAIVGTLGQLVSTSVGSVTLAVSGATTTSDVAATAVSTGTYIATQDATVSDVRTGSLTVNNGVVPGAIAAGDMVLTTGIVPTVGTVRATIANLASVTATVGSFSGTSITTGQLNTGTATFSNLSASSANATNVVIPGVSTGTLTADVTAGGIVGSSSQFTTLTPAHINATNITGGSLSASGVLSSPLVTLTTANVGTIANTRATAGTVVVSTSINTLPTSTATIGSVTVTSSGNVGINTTAPQFTLDLSGSARVTSGVTTGTLTASSISSANVSVQTGTVTTAAVQNNIVVSGGVASGTVASVASVVTPLVVVSAVSATSGVISGISGTSGNVSTLVSPNVVAASGVVQALGADTANISFTILGGVVSSSNVAVSSATFGTLVSSQVSTGTLRVSTGTVTNVQGTTSGAVELRATTVSTGSVVIATAANTQSIDSTRLSAGTLTLTGTFGGTEMILTGDLTTSTLQVSDRTRTDTVASAQTGSLGNVTLATASGAFLQASTGTVQATTFVVPAVSATGMLTASVVNAGQIGSTRYSGGSFVVSTGSTTPAVAGTSVSTDLLTGTGAIVDNLVFSTATLSTAGVSQISQVAVQAGTVASTTINAAGANVTDAVFTGLVSANANATSVFGSFTTGNVVARDTVIGTLGSTTVSATNLVPSTITTGSLTSTSSVSTGALRASAASATHFIVPTIGTATLTATNMTAPSVLAQTATFTTLGATVLSAGTVTGGSMSLSGNVNIAGGLIVGTITAANLKNTRITAGTANVTELLSIGGANTIGSITTTAGNVGINTTAPAYTLDVAGTGRVTTGVTTGTLTSSSVSAGSVFGGTAAMTNVFGTTVSVGSMFISSASTAFTLLLATTSVNTGSVGAALAQHSTISVTGVSAGTVALQSLAADTLVSSSNLLATTLLSATRVRAATLVTATAANITGTATVNAATVTDLQASTGLVTDAQTVSLRATDTTAVGVNSTTMGVTNISGTSGSFSNVSTGLLTTGTLRATALSGSSGNLIASSVATGTVASTLVSTANVITTSGMTIGNFAFTSGTGLTASVSGARAGVVAVTGGLSTGDILATTATFVGVRVTGGASIVGLVATSGSLTTANATSVTAGVLQGNTQVSFGSARAGTVSSATLFVSGLGGDAVLASTSVSTGTVSANSNNTIGSLVASTFTITSGNVTAVGATGVSVVANNVTAGTVLAGSLNAPNAAFTNVSAGTITSTTVNAVNINFGSLSNNGVAYSASQWTTTSANIFYTAGNVGINTTAPTRTLDVAGAARVSTGLTTGNVNFTGTITQNGVPFSSAKWVTSGTSLFNSTGNVAIGTSTVSFALDVSGNARAANAVTAANAVITGYMNTYGNTVHTTAGTAYTVNLETLSNRARTSRANATAAVSSWTTRVSAADRDWYSVTWSPELSLFVAVAQTGTGNRVMTSPNGLDWTTRASAADNSWSSVTWSPELSIFVAVAYTGTGNRVMTSPDGITWTTRASAANNWSSVVWSPELSLFVAVAYTGTGNRVMTSPDGITWTTRASAADNWWYDVAWSPELSLFVAVAYTGIGNKVMTSPDGINWTTRVSAADNTWYSVTWSPELSLFVAVAASGTGNRVMTSSDGITWTTRATNNNDWFDVTWSPELSLFVAVAGSGSGNRVMTSSNGITWTTRASAADNQWWSVTWSPELSRFVAVANSGTGNRVMTSAIALPASESTPLISPAYLTVTEGNVNLAGTLTMPSRTQTGMTVATVAVTGTVTSGGVFSTNASVGTLLRGTATSMANVSVTDGVTAANVRHSNVTVGTIISTFASTGTVRVTSDVTTGNLGGTIGSFDTVTASTVGASVISGVDAQVTGDLALGGALTTTRITASNIVNTNVTTSTAVVGNMAAQGMSITSYPLTSGVSLAYTLRIDGAGAGFGTGSVFLGTAANTVITTAPDGSIYVAVYNVTQASFYATDGTTIVGTMAGTGKVGYVAKYTPTGSLQYTLRIDGGGSDGENNSAITTDASGNVYVAGYSQSSPVVFYATDGTTVLQTMANSNTSTQMAYIAKYNSLGSLQHTLRIDNTGDESNTSITTDASGNVYVTGWSSSSSGVRFYATNGTTIVQTMANLGSTYVAYTAKYSSVGALLYTLRVDGVGTTEEYNSAIETDIDGNVYVGGYSNGTIASFYAINGTTVVATMANAGGASGSPLAYVAKYNSSGTLQYTLRIDGTAHDYINAITTDSNNNIYVAGLTQSSPIRFYATDGTTIVSTTSSLGRSGYIAKYNSSGALQYTLRIDGSGFGTESNTAITTDASGNVFVVGYSNSTAARFYATDGVTILQTMANASTSGYVGYIAKYSPLGSLQYTLRVDGNNNEYNTSVTTATDGSVYIAGYSNSTIASFYATDGTTITSTMANTATSGSAVAYIAKYTESINYTGYVLSTTGGVAIGKATPTVALDVSGTVRSTNLVTGAVTASSGRITNLSATTLTTTNPIRVSSAGSVATVSAQATSVSAANVLATSAAIDNFMTPSGQVDSLFVSDTQVPGATITTTIINAPTVRGTNVSSTTGTFTTVNAQAFGVINASVGTLSLAGLAATSGAFGTVSVVNTISTGTLLVSGTAQATGASFALVSTGALAVGQATITNVSGVTGVSAGTMSVSGASVTTVTVTDVISTTGGSFVTIASLNVTSTNVTAGSVSFTTVGSTSVFAGNATLSTLVVSGGTLVGAQVTGLSGTNVFIGAGTAVTAASTVVTTGGLQATDGVFTSTNTTHFFAASASNPTTQSNVIVTNSLNSTEGRFTQLTGPELFVGSATTATLTVPFDVTVGNINYTNSLLVGGVSVATRWATPASSANLVITSGNVGINTTTPQHRLDVSGSARVTGAVTTSNVALTELAQNGSPVSLVSQWATRGSAAVYGNGLIGGNLEYTLRIDGTNSDRPVSITTAADGSVYVTGSYTSTSANFYATNGTTVVQTLGNLNTSSGNIFAGFIAKYTPTGSLEYTLRIDGTLNETIGSITTAADGSVYAAGYYDSTQANFYATNGTTVVQTLGNLNTSSGNIFAGFIAKYTPAGALQYTLRIDGTLNETIGSIATAADGSVYVTGSYTSTSANFYATNGTTIVQTLGNLNTNNAGFIAKYTSGGALQYTLRIDGTINEEPVSITTAGDGSVYVTGYYGSSQANLYATDGTTILGTLGTVSAGLYVGFIAKYTSGGALQYTLRIDGARSELPVSITTATDGSVYVTGYYGSTQANFYATNGTTIVQTLGNLAAGTTDAGFIAKYTPTGSLEYTLRIDGTNSDQLVSITTAGDGSMYMTGYYSSTQANLYATNGTTIVQTLGNLSTTGNSLAGFIAKYTPTGSLQYTLRIDGTHGAPPVSITTAGDGSMYVTGYYSSTQANLYATNGTTILGTLGNLGGFVCYIAKYVDRTVTGGNLAIGTITPTAQLDVSGGARVTGTLTAANLVLTGYMNTYGNTVFTTSGTTAFASNIESLSYRSRTSRANATAAVATWTTRVSAVDNQWQSVVWAPELSIFAAVSSTGSANQIMTSPDGINWTSRTTPTNTFTAITWSSELSIFVVVAALGTGNRVMTSPDGIVWTTRSSAADNSWQSVVWSPELRLFVAVAYSGTGNRVMTSSNGITWTTRSSAANNDWYDVAWSPELSLFVAVAASGTGNRVMTSPDGITWTTRVSGEDNTWYDVAWSSELSLFVAVAFSGTNRVMTSPDGFTWTTRTAAAANQWRGLTWSPELSVFVAVSADGGSSRLMTSHDGIRWTTRTGNVTSSWRSVAWSPELSRFVVVGSGAAGINVMTSPIALPAARSVPLITSTATDGNLQLTGTVNVTGQVTAGPLITDTLATDTFTTTTVTTANAQADFATVGNVTLTSFTPTNLAAGSLNVGDPTLSQTLAINTYGNLVNTTTSTTQITQRLNTQLARTRASVADVRRVLSNTAWTTRAVPGGQWRAFAWSPELGIFAALPASASGNLAMTSPDGVNWTVRSTAPDVTSGWSSMAWSPELRLFAATSQGGSVVATSPDGVTWTTRSAGTAYNVIWVPELSIFVASGSTAGRTSSDGITWTARTLPSGNWSGVAWSPELSLIVAVAQSEAYVAVSSDGTSWSTRSAPSALWNSIAWSPELSVFVAYGNSVGYVMRSSDATNWTTHSTRSISSGVVTWSPELSVFVAAGHQTTTGAYSRDGILWTTYNLGTNYSFQTPCWSPELSRFVVLGNVNATTGGVATSPIALPAARSVPLVSPAYISATESNIQLSATVTASSLRVTSGALFVAGAASTIGSFGQHLLYTLRIDSTSSEFNTGVAIDPSNNSVYVAGYSNNNGTQTVYATNGTSSMTTFTGRGYVVKYNSSGVYQYVLRSNVASSSITVKGVAVANDGSCYVAGDSSNTTFFYNTDGTTVLTTMANLSTVGFIAKYNNSGALQYTLRIDGTLIDNNNAVATDASGNVYVAGRSTSTQANFYATDGTTVVTTMASVGGSVGYVAKYNSSGALQYTLRIDGSGGGGNEVNNAIAIDPSDSSVYVAGTSLSTTTIFYATNGTTTVANVANANFNFNSSYTAKYNSAGALQYVLRIDGTVNETNTCVVVDNSSNVYVAGYSDSTSASFYATNGTTIVATMANVSSVGYIAKYNSSGALLYTLRIDGTGSEQNNAITTDSTGNMYVTGISTTGFVFFYATDGTSVVSTMANLFGSQMAYIAKYNSSGALQYTLMVDGTGTEASTAITTDASGTVYVTGWSTSTQASFYATDGTTVIGTMANVATTVGNSFAYIAKYRGDPLNTPTIATTSGSVGINNTAPSSTLHVGGSLAKVSGTFDIKHPVHRSKRLLHSFIEGPRCDLIYRGTVQLEDGTATVDLDAHSVADSGSAMTPGTFVALTCNPDVFLTNKTGFGDLVYTLQGATLTITCEDPTSNDTVSWMVIAERGDNEILQWNRTNADGQLVTEYTP